MAMKKNDLFLMRSQERQEVKISEGGLVTVQCHTHCVGKGPNVVHSIGLFNSITHGYFPQQPY